MTSLARSLLVLIAFVIPLVAIAAGASGTASAAGSTTPPAGAADPRSTTVPLAAPLAAPLTAPLAAQATAHPTGLRCDACHTPEGWRPARFAHERTGFPLNGRHVAAACTDCHRRDWSDPMPQSCAGCHLDPHAQEFGLMCRSCHDERGWQPLFLVDAHRRTQFPLSGRHGTLPCEECHVEKRERTFTRAALGCVDCHRGDAARASSTTLDHRALAPSCQSCHVPTSFEPARLPAHEVCFPLAGTVHAPVRCAECHVARALVGARVTGACRSLVRCADCHEHAKELSDRQHQGVVGYSHASDKCAACHRAVR